MVIENPDIENPAMGGIDRDGFAVSQDAFGTWDLWFRPCEDPGCVGEHTLVLATRMGRDRLVPVVRAVEEAAGRVDRDTFDIGDPEVLVVHLDLVFGQPFEDDPHPAHALVAGSLSGELLDQVHERWLAARGRPPSGRMASPDAERARSWIRGELIGFGEAFPESRVDAWLDPAGEPVALIDLYCVVPGCPCPLAVLQFVRPADPQTELATFDLDYRSGRAPALRTATERACWEAFVARYPRWRERLAARHREIRPYGLELGAAPNRGWTIPGLWSNRRSRRQQRGRGRRS